MARILLFCGVAALLTACHDVRPDVTATALSAAESTITGDWDNFAQVRQSPVTPHVQVAVRALDGTGVALWRITLASNPSLGATFAMHTTSSDGEIVMTPYRPVTAQAAAATRWDPAQWIALEGCALRGTTSPGATVAADTAACAAIAPGLGGEAALLPLAITLVGTGPVKSAPVRGGQDGEWLHVRLYADQARGADARTELRRVRWYGGWAALNGGGPRAVADSRDWHMNRDLRLGSEGGRAALKWRDGGDSGYAVALERLRYAESGKQILKLSVVEEAGGQVLTYAWADPDARSIGLHLGWLQVGFDAESLPAR